MKTLNAPKATIDNNKNISAITQGPMKQVGLPSLKQWFSCDALLYISAITQGPSWPLYSKTMVFLVQSCE